MGEWLDNPWGNPPHRFDNNITPIDGPLTLGFDEPNDEAAAERLWKETKPATPEPAPPTKSSVWQRLNDAALRFVTGWPTLSTLIAVALFWAVMFGVYKLVALALQVFA